jgi:hypothetical protein
MTTLLNKWFLAFSALWIVIFTCTKFEIYLYRPVQFYFIDFIAIPILGNLSLAFYRWFQKNKQVTLPIWSILYLVFSLSIVFEIFMPQYYLRYSSDIIDVLMYCFGGIFFHFVMNKNHTKSYE